MGKKKEAPMAITSQDELTKKRAIPVEGFMGLILVIVWLSVLYAVLRVALAQPDVVELAMLAPAALGAIGFILFVAIKR